MNRLRLALVALLLTTEPLWAQPDLHQRAQDFLATFPRVQEIIVGGSGVNPDPEEARLICAVQAPVPPEVKALEERAQQLGLQLEAKYPDPDPSKLQQDPLFAEMAQISEHPTMVAHRRKSQQVSEALSAYRRSTLEWLSRRSRNRAKGWQGQAVLMLDRPTQGRFTSWVDFRADQSFYQSSLGRQCWTGGYQVHFQADEIGPQRSINRPGKAFTQMFLGRDGWFIKFAPLRSQDFQVSLPTLSSLLLGIPGDQAGYSHNGEPGYRLEKARGVVDPVLVLQGYPYDPSSARQRMAVSFQGAAGSRVKVAFDFSPIP